MQKDTIITSTYIELNTRGSAPNRIDFNEITYVRAVGDYVQIHTDNSKKHMLFATMKSIESKFPADVFLRIHRGWIIHVNKVIAVETDKVMIGLMKLPIGEKFRKIAKQKLKQFVTAQTT